MPRKKEEVGTATKTKKNSAEKTDIKIEDTKDKDLLKDNVVVEINAKNDEVEEAVIPAEITGMVERKKKNIENVSNKEKTTNQLNIYGIQSDEIIEQDAKLLSQKEIDNKIFTELVRYERSRQLLWGEIFAIEESDEPQFKNKVIISVLYNGVKVLIPDFEYFEKSFNFGNRYAEMSEREQFEKRRLMANYQKGARVCFILKAVSRAQIKGGEFDKEYEVFAVGSRKEAMELVRDIWFFHKQHKDPNTIPRKVQIGDIAPAHVISVREDNALVEVCGVETRIDAYSISNDIVDNCNDVVSPGDTINVRIKKIYTDPDGTVSLSVSGRLNDPNKLINGMKVNSSYLGTVDSYNSNKKLYTVVLKNGVFASVREEYVEGGLMLYPGDKVSVRVRTIMPTFVIGNAIKV